MRKDLQAYLKQKKINRWETNGKLMSKKETKKPKRKKNVYEEKVVEQFKKLPIYEKMRKNDTFISKNVRLHYVCAALCRWLNWFIPIKSVRKRNCINETVLLKRTKAKTGLPKL